MKSGRKSLIPLQCQVDNILRTYFETSEADRAEGLAWYAKAWTWCEDTGTRYGIDPKRVAGALAALSPMVNWDQNLIDCLNVVRATPRGRSRVKVTTYGQNRAKASRILDGADPEESLGQHKTLFFYRGIIGRSGVCIDRHAAAVAVGRRLDEKERGQIVGRVYFTMAAAYEKAAFALALEPRELQAIVWVHWRKKWDI